MTVSQVHGNCAAGFYSASTANDESGLRTGPFGLLPSLAADVGYLVNNQSGNAISNGSGFNFEGNDYIGAVAPYETVPWWSGWLTPRSRVITVR